MGENNSTLTYSVPGSMNVKQGQIVTIPLRNRQTKGIIFNLTNNKPGFKTRDIVSIEKESPHLQTWQIELIKWISDYYVSPLSKTLKLFLPTTLIKRKKELKITVPADNEENQIKFKHVLSENQQCIIDAINKSKNKISLLHGITGSGKTEVYLNFLEPLVKAGKQVLILVPEISLTPQTCRRFEEFFQEKVIAIHSHLTPKQKEEAWYKIHKNNVKIIIGSRSALFAPFQNLAAIIIDEEHDSCYKQDQNPRYNAIDVAKKISELLNIKVIMGSATPSVETYYLAKKGAYDLYELNERANQKNSLLPKTAIVDMREEIKKKNFSIFSEGLAKQMTEKLTNNEQIILFLNRRGAASAVICRECGFTIDCEECQIPMTYHKKFAVEGRMFNAEKLICHHCGLIKTVPVKCPQCSSVYIKYIGLGTQRIEEDCQLMFPFARVLRADRDTTQKKGDFENMYNQFRKHQADILIGTQMISIGLHLPKVNLVGVVMSDIGITIPNFRSAEKTFQLITQVAG
ncbi:primosomal protein N', partial [Candidatus Peregrinibacteria bacterium]|nr:primosomal protein N' [Candidatus Peregrinibacteria bacterium]